MKTLLTLLFILVSLSANDLSFVDNNETLSSKKTAVYTIQLFVTNKINYAQKLVKRMSDKFQNETHIYKSGKYYSARFAQSESYKYLKPFLLTLHQTGFKEAYISELTFEQMKRELIEEPITKKTNKQKIITSTKETPLYTIQLFAVDTLAYAQKLTKSLPNKLQDKTYMYKSRGYFAAGFAQSSSYKYLKPFVLTLKKAGFKGAYIRESIKKKPVVKAKKKIEKIQKKQEVQVVQEKQEVQKKQAKKIEKITKVTKVKITQHISRFSISNIILKANSAYKDGNEFEAIIYYEMLSATGYSNDKIKNNSCYLYGKRGDWLKAKALIDSEKYQSKLLYAYAYGAVQSNQNNYYGNISPYIVRDKSGLLALLTASYFERRENAPRASFFYKMAHDKNPSNPYIVYLYARDADISHDVKKAKKFYKEVLQRVGFEHQLYIVTKKRLQQIGD